MLFRVHGASSRVLVEIASWLPSWSARFRLGAAPPEGAGVGEARRELKTPRVPDSCGPAPSSVKPAAGSQHCPHGELWLRRRGESACILETWQK